MARRQWPSPTPPTRSLLLDFVPGRGDAPAHRPVANVGGNGEGAPCGTPTRARPAVPSARHAAGGEAWTPPVAAAPPTSASHDSATSSVSSSVCSWVRFRGENLAERMQTNKARSFFTQINSKRACIAVVRIVHCLSPSKAVATSCDMQYQLC